MSHTLRRSAGVMTSTSIIAIEIPVKVLHRDADSYLLNRRLYEDDTRCGSETISGIRYIPFSMILAAFGSTPE